MRALDLQEDEPSVEEDETLVLEPCPVGFEELNVASVAMMGGCGCANTYCVNFLKVIGGGWGT